VCLGRFGKDLFGSCEWARLLPSVAGDPDVVIEEGISCGRARCAGSTTTLARGVEAAVRLRVIRGMGDAFDIRSEDDDVIGIEDVSRIDDPCGDEVPTLEASLTAVGPGTTELVVTSDGVEVERYLVDVLPSTEFAIRWVDVFDEAEERAGTLLLALGDRSLVNLTATPKSESDDTLFGGSETIWTIDDDSVAHFFGTERSPSEQGCVSTEAAETIGAKTSLVPLASGSATVTARMGEFTATLPIEVVDSID
jgi:hypothetical protein